MLSRVLEAIDKEDTGGLEILRKLILSIDDAKEELRAQLAKADQDVRDVIDDKAPAIFKLVA